MILRRLFVDLNKLSPSLQRDLREDNVILHPYDSFYEQLKSDVHQRDPTDKFCVMTSSMRRDTASGRDLRFRHRRRAIMPCKRSFPRYSSAPPSTTPNEPLLLVSVSKKQLVLQDDIVYDLKSVKNDCEIQGMKRAHVRRSFSIRREEPCSV